MEIIIKPLSDADPGEGGGGCYGYICWLDLPIDPICPTLGASCPIFH